MSPLYLATDMPASAANPIIQAAHQRALVRFTADEDSPQRDRLALNLTLGSAALVMALGLILMTAQVPALRQMANPVRRQVRLRLDAVSIPIQEEPQEPVVAEPEVDEIPRLEPQAILSAPVDRPAVESEQPAAVAPQTTEPAPAEPPRRVYGVRKVYAKGLGAGATGTGGLVTKQGNTLGGQRDSLTATAADLQGELAALSTIDQAPEPLHRAKPDYSPDMRQARAEGVVSAYLLVDADGSVQDVKITADIGWDSAQVATQALRRFTFRPAIKNGEPVAVWILHRIRFEFQE